MAELPKKISELDSITDVSDKDLLIVSDYDHDAGSPTSKKMEIQQLTSFIRGKMPEMISEILSASVLSIIRDNARTIGDILDGKEDGIDLLSTIGNKVETDIQDGTLILSSGIF